MKQLANDADAIVNLPGRAPITGVIERLPHQDRQGSYHYVIELDQPLYVSLEGSDSRAMAVSRSITAQDIYVTAR